jgi:VanZ family protein
MSLGRRHKYILLAVGIYWPLIFWLTHIPIPALARRSGMSDKTMHVLAYMVLTFLLWLAVNPYQKATWRRLSFWVILGAVLVYAALDEVLQGRIGRGADFRDFLADLLGAVLAMGILSLLSFWPAILAVSAIFIFVIQNLSNLTSLWPQYHLNTVFHFTAYAAFSLLWMHFLVRNRPDRAAAKWLLEGLAAPLLLLAAVCAGSPIRGKEIYLCDISTAVFAIAASIWASYIILFCKRPADSFKE